MEEELAARMIKELKDLVECKKMLREIWSDIDPNCFPQHIWGRLNSYFEREKLNAFSKNKEGEE